MPLEFDDDEVWNDPDPAIIYCGYCRYFPCLCDYGTEPHYP